MYNEENNEKNYFFRNLIVKILLVLLFVFLLMWLFPMPNLNPFYDKIFTQNINEMTDAAKSYFTVTRLPKEEGEVKTLTLKEMLDNKMLIEFTDSDGKKCDVDKSYVSVTKKDGEYTFKTNLSCSGQEDYVITYFGCYDVCEGDKCKVEEVIEYEFYKITTEKFIDKYVCEAGYTLSGTKCIISKNTDENKNATVNCPTGYTFNSTSVKCEKQASESFDAEKKCATGYTYDANANICKMTTTRTENADYEYKCAIGTLSGTKCIISTPNLVEKTPTFSCPTGTGELSADKSKCVLEVPSRLEYSCSQGTLSGTSCIITTTYTTPVTCSYTNWVCSYPIYSYAKDTSSTPTYTLKFLYELATGGFKHEECTRKKVCTGGDTYTKTTTVPAESELVCDAGNITADKTKCIVETPSKLEYTCPTGVPSGTHCIVTTITEQPANKIYSCKTGTISGDKCIISVTLTDNYSYSCPYGTRDGSKCIVTVSDKKDPCYSCESGYSLVGTKCYKTTTITDSKDATIIYKTGSQKYYKWSRSKTLEGWTPTGRTRTVAVSS